MAASFTFLQQFRTVVSGSRFHGQLLVNQSKETIFSLKIQCSANKQQAYQLMFDSQYLDQYKLKDSFTSSKELYDHLSKMTKIKVKLDEEAKILSILHEKEKILKEFSINLIEASKNNCQFEKKQVETTFSDQKEQNIQDVCIEKSNEQISVDETNQPDKEKIVAKQTNVENYCKNSENNETNENKQKKQIESESVTEKIEQLKKYIQKFRARDQTEPSVRQSKAITYTFSKQQNQSLTLYEFAIQNKAPLLADLIQSEKLEKTQQILIKRNKLTSVPPFNQISLECLMHLSLEENKIKTIENLEKMSNLQKLNLDGNQISLISNLSHLHNIKTLKLGNNAITKIQNLQKLINLETLWLDFNSIQKIQGLCNLTKLKSLNLSFNTITKIENLASLTNLEELLLNQNQISQIQNLQPFNKLTRLSLNMNAIRKVKGLKKLLLLQVIYLSQNLIEEFDKNAYEEINWLKMLKQFKINANNIQWNPESNNFVDRLRNYGVKVTI